MLLSCPRGENRSYPAAKPCNAIFAMRSNVRDRIVKENKVQWANECMFDRELSEAQWAVTRYPGLNHVDLSSVVLHFRPHTPLPAINLAR